LQNLRNRCLSLSLGLRKDHYSFEVDWVAWTHWIWRQSVWGHWLERAARSNYHTGNYEDVSLLWWDSDGTEEFAQQHVVVVVNNQQSNPHKHNQCYCRGEKISCRHTPVLDLFKSSSLTRASPIRLVIIGDDVPDDPLTVQEKLSAP
jgi:hypothetical protein